LVHCSFGDGLGAAGVLLVGRIFSEVTALKWAVTKFFKLRIGGARS
jgi:hypothetical protein